MPEKWDIDEVHDIVIGTTPCWQVNLKRPDGVIVAHIMPQATLENRAGELGMDATDVDGIMDVILHEQHVPMTPDSTGGTRFLDDGPTLLQASSTAEAREAHLARCKNANIRIPVKGHKALDRIRKNHKPDLKRVQAVKERVDITRWKKNYGDLPDIKPVDLSRKGAAEKMREALGLTVSIPNLRRE